MQHDTKTETAEQNGAPKPATGIARLFASLKHRGSAPAHTAPAAEVPEFVKPEHVFLGQDLADRDSVFAFIADRAVELGMATDAAELVEAFLAREAEGTTGMMEGFAIPHAKTAAVNEAAIVVVKDPAGVTDWDTMDAKPVNVAIALLIPGSQAGTTHLRMLSKMAEALMDERFRATVRESDDASAIARAINEHLA